ncbi:hypothetical protein HA402_003074 [Bradysia odoriphaga]|nr:hypothetical protein HA402_003074 [Bradysia odoriphaga]
MPSPIENIFLEYYVRWALSVKDPMTIEYSERADYVTVKIPLDFLTEIVCKECDEDGPHITPDHIFLISLNTETNEMTMTNDYENECIIPPNTEAFESIKSQLCANDNECYFYGRVDEDDRTKLYINIDSLPTQ